MPTTSLLQALLGVESAAAGDQCASDAGQRSPKPKRAAPSDVEKPDEMTVSAAALGAPASEAALAAVRIDMTGESLAERLRAAVSGLEPHHRRQITYESLGILVSEEDDQKPAVGGCSCGLCRCECCPAFLEWLRAAVSAPAIPPGHRKRQEKLMGKRQVLYGVALGAPVALLTSAAATATFPSGSAAWIAGLSAFVWVAVSGAVVANQYGRTNVEMKLASCLGRLGVMGVAVLFSLYVSFAFFPSTTVAVVLLVCFAVGLHGFLCIMSRLKGGDDQISGSSGDAEDTDGSCGGCRCCGCGCAMDV